MIGKMKWNDTYQVPGTGLKFPLQMGIELESKISLSLWRKPLVAFPANLGNLQIPRLNQHTPLL